MSSIAGAMLENIEDFDLDEASFRTFSSASLLYPKKFYAPIEALNRASPAFGSYSADRSFKGSECIISTPSSTYGTRETSCTMDARPFLTLATKASSPETVIGDVSVMLVKMAPSAPPSSIDIQGPKASMR